METKQFLLMLSLIGSVMSDIYMHNPRGSNNRLNEKSAQRSNANRLFDSQNNNRGGHNVGDKGPEAAKTEDDQYRMLYFQSGADPKEATELLIQWTHQHGCGTNEADNPNKLNCNVVIQYMNSENKTKIKNGIKSGNLQFSNNKANDDKANKDKGLHESREYYGECKTRNRNRGLYLADQRLQGDSAIYTRQNRQGTKRGFECPEERDYFPYWHPTPWKDIVVLTSDVTECEYYKRESANSKPRGKCVNIKTAEATEYNNIFECEDNNQTWVELWSYHEVETTMLTEDECKDSGDIKRVWGIPYDTKDYKEKKCIVLLKDIDCQAAIKTRANHHGNTAGGVMLNYTWILPNFSTEQNVIVRIRYNISTDDYDAYAPNPCFGGSCYTAYSTFKNHADAKKACEAQDAYLVAVETLAELDFIKEVILPPVRNNFWRSFWTGAQEGTTFQWVTPEGFKDIGSDGWAPGQPDNKNQNCAVLNHKWNYLFSDELCTRRNYFICERKDSIPDRPRALSDPKLKNNPTVSINVAEANNLEQTCTTLDNTKVWGSFVDRRRGDNVTQCHRFCLDNVECVGYMHQRTNELDVCTLYRRISKNKTDASYTFFKGGLCRNNDVPLRLAINTAQFGRTFQDRSHALILAPRPLNVFDGIRILNLNVRGKRGNIVQVFPAVEYDFVPNSLELDPKTEAVHIQWTGSNSHNNGGPGGDGQTGDAGQGTRGTDRHNLVEIASPLDNFPVDFEVGKMFDDVKILWTSDGVEDGVEDVKVALASAGIFGSVNATKDSKYQKKCVDKPNKLYRGTNLFTRLKFEDIKECERFCLEHPECVAYSFEKDGEDGFHSCEFRKDKNKLKEQGRNTFDSGRCSAEKEMDPLLNDANASFPGVVVQFTKEDIFYYMCTRNNAFTNRSQKGRLIVKKKK